MFVRSECDLLINSQIGTFDAFDDSFKAAFCWTWSHSFYDFNEKFCVKKTLETDIAFG